MKRLLPSLILLLTIGNAMQAQQNSVYVDERTELMSIVFRLAGANEYVNKSVAKYNHEIDSTFKPFKTHALIQYAKQLHENDDVAYEAVMNYATLLEIEDGKINLKKGIADNSFDSRWEKGSIEKFLQLLNEFYVESNFHAFYEQQKPLYALVEKRIAKTLQEVDFGWLEKYYRTNDNGKTVLIPNLNNGWRHYNNSIEYNDGHKDIYVILGIPEFDSLGYPVYSQNMMNIIMHEYNYLFCEPLIDEYYAQMQENAEALYKMVKNRMSKQLCEDARMMMYETLVRTVEIRYLLSKWIDIKDVVKQQNYQGYLFVEPMIELFKQYEVWRKHYVTLRDFMPEIVKCVNGFSVEKLQKKKKKF